MKKNKQNQSDKKFNSLGFIDSPINLFIIGAIVIVSYFLFLHNPSISIKDSAEKHSNEDIKFQKPNICDCKNAFLKDVEEALNYKETELSTFSKECEKYYTAEELTNANCGLEKYDPNFKAR